MEELDMNSKVFILGQYKWGTRDHEVESAHKHANTHISFVRTATCEVNKAKPTPSVLAEKLHVSVSETT